MFRIALMFFVIVLYGCSSTPKLGENTGVPGDSITTISPYLLSDAITNITEWVRDNYDCDSIEVANTEWISQEGEILMDDKGRLFSGTISEKWTIAHCNVQTKLAIIFTPDGKGGSYVAIAKL